MKRRWNDVDSRRQITAYPVDGMKHVAIAITPAKALVLTWGNTRKFAEYLLSLTLEMPRPCDGCKIGYEVVYPCDDCKAGETIEE